MNKKYNKIDMYYQKQSEFTKNICIWCILFSIISVFTSVHLNLYNIILSVICLVVIMILLIFITHSYNINPNNIFKIIKINTIIILCSYILQLVNLDCLKIIKYFLFFNFGNNFMEYGSIYFFIGYYIVSKNKHNKSIVIEYNMLLIVILILNVLSNWKSDNIIIMIVYSIIIEIILLITLKNTLKDRLLVNGKINIFIVNSLSNFICINVRQLAKIFDWDILYIIITNINVAIFVVVLSEIINNINGSMYDFMFKDIHNLNENLDNINNEIILRNKELEKSEIEIEYKQNSYRELLNLLPKAIVIVNTENNRISYCNYYFKELIGVNDIRKILNKKIEKIIRMDFDYNNINSSSVGGQYFGSNILDNENNLEIRLSNYSESKKEITITFEDITEKQKIEVIKGELERKKVNDDIKKSFLSNISHDFKIPVNVISSATQLENLLITNKDIEGVKKYNSISKQNCLTLIKLTNNIIDISKISAEYVNPTLTSGNIVEFVEDLVVSLVDYAKISKISIIFDTYKEELYMKYDRELMERILLNLVSNSIKFTPEDGYINITISDTDKYIFITVEDTGIGMDEKFAKEAFNKYSMNVGSVYANVQGTGVGLYVVYNLVDLQKGEIRIESEIGKGTKFIMKFFKE